MHECVRSTHLFAALNTPVCNHRIHVEVKAEFTRASPTLITTLWIILAPSPCLSVNSHCNSEKLAPTGHWPCSSMFSSSVRVRV